MAFRRTALWLVLVAFFAGVAHAHASGDTVWTATGGPPGGSVTALIAPASVPGALLAGTTGGIYLTRDNGNHWQPSFSGLGDLYISALATSPDATLIYAGTRNGIYRSRDGGATWSRSDPRLSDQLISSLVVDPLNSGVAYASTASNVFKTENGGEEWNDITPLRPIKVSSLALSPDSATVYVVADSGIHASSDRGAHWSVLVSTLPDGTSASALLITDRGLLASSAQYLYRSQDGKGWSPVTGLQGSQPIRPLAVDAQDASRVFAGTNRGLARSSDGGQTWLVLPNPPAEPRLLLTILVGAKGTVYLGTMRGVWRTQNDGSTWEPLNTGLSGSTISSLLFAPSDPGTLLAATPYGIWYSRDRGAAWLESQGVLDPPVLSLAADPTAPNVIYAGTSAGSVLASKDGGANFVRLPSLVGSKKPVTSLAVFHPSSNSTALFAGTIGEGVYKTLDEGKTWTALSSGLGDSSVMTTFAFASPATLFAGTDRGLYRLDAAKPNATWYAASSALPSDQVVAIVPNPRQSKSLLVLFGSSGMYKSEDAGATWKPIGQGELKRVRSLAQRADDPNILYLGTDKGVYRSSDGGNTWAPLSDGLPLGTDASALAIDPRSPDKVFIGTGAFGVLGSADVVTADETPWFPIAAGAVVGVTALGLIFVFLSRVRRRPRAVRSAPVRSAPVRTKDISESTISNALWTSGEANSDSLPGLEHDKVPKILLDYLKHHPDDSLTLDTSATRLKLDNYTVSHEFFGDWQVAREAANDPESFAAITSEMVDQLCHLLGFARVEERDYKGLIGYVVRAPTLRLKIPSRFPIIFMPPRQVTEDDMAALRDLMGILDLTGYFALLLDLHDNAEAGQRRTLKHLARQAIHDYIVLDKEDVHRFFAARDPVRRLVERILEQVDLSVISPYVTSGPVPDNMFFGREHELKTILRTIRSTNYAIVGGRKIGKTSVLARVHRLLKESPEFLPFYLDCQAVHSDDDFCEAIETLWHAPMPSRSPEGFRRMILDLLQENPNRCLVLLFDEIDALLQDDVAHGERLLHIFRALSQQNQVRFVFCGEKQLCAASKDPRLVFFNFCTVIQLTYLIPSEALRIVVEPMQDMGITIEPGVGLAEYIVRESAGHPNILQFICQKLIEQINAHQATTILREDAQAVLASAEYGEYVTAIIWGNSDPLERLITCLMLDCRETTSAALADLLRKRQVPVTPAQLQNALDGLCLNSVLRRDGPQYALANDKFADALRHTQDVNGLVASLARGIQ